MFIILFAFLADALLGDPAWLPHPVVQIGRLIAFLEKRLRPLATSTSLQLWTGSLLALATVSVTYSVSRGVLAVLNRFHPALGTVAAVLLLATTFAARGLQEAAVKVYNPLQAGNLPAARQAVAMIVGRDTEKMTPHEVARAAVETVAENTVDGVTAPIFYALLGGAPLALLYKAINTMDSMLGYKNERYFYFGRAAARLDDVANWLPARLTVPAMLLAAYFLRFNVKSAFMAMRRDSRLHPSPNSGFAEATTAGALGIVLGGQNSYFGQSSERPLLWREGRPAVAPDIKQATRLMQVTSVIFLLGGLAVRALIIACFK